MLSDAHSPIPITREREGRNENCTWNKIHAINLRHFLCVASFTTLSFHDCLFYPSMDQYNQISQRQNGEISLMGHMTEVRRSRDSCTKQINKWSV